MKALKGTGGQRQRITDELRQLKQMSKNLRTKSLRAMLERHANQLVEARRLPAPGLKVPSVAA